MLQCKTCGEVFLGVYILEGSTADFKPSATNTHTLHTFSRGHKNEYPTVDYTDRS
jgi:hypothetical protein